MRVEQAGRFPQAPPRLSAVRAVLEPLLTHKARMARRSVVQARLEAVVEGAQVTQEPIIRVAAGVAAGQAPQGA